MADPTRRSRRRPAVRLAAGSRPGDGRRVCAADSAAGRVRRNRSATASAKRTAEGEAILPRLRETPGDRLLRDRPGKPAEILKAGLLLLHGDLDAAHRIAQQYEGDRDADAWHALVHRLEGDFGNSGYWWRRVGDHPIFAALADRFGESWNPQDFTDRYRRAMAGSDDAARAAVRSVQAAEFALLLGHCAA